MADQDGRHSEIVAQLLRHVTSQPHDMDAKGDIFRHTTYPPSVIAIVLILGDLRLQYEYEIEYEYDFWNQERILKIIKWHINIVPKRPSRQLISGREKRQLWESNWFEIRKSYSYSILYLYSDLKLPIIGVTEGAAESAHPEDQKTLV